MMTIMLAASTLAIAPSAAAQIRVDARIHASSGSCSNCDLSNKRMNGMQLKNANFAGSMFNNSNLSGGQIDGSDLTGAHFRKALLYRLQGQKVTMPGAMMEDATLTEANLSNSLMPKISLERADLSRAKFTGNDMRGSNFINATAAGVNFTGSDFEGARLDHVNLEDAKLTGSNMRHVRFGNAILLRTDLTKANLSGADMSSAQGLKQEQLDTACGDMNTQLPMGLSVPYCEGTMMAAAAEHDHSALDPNMARAADSLDRAMKDVEGLLSATPRADRATRRKLERIHADIANSKRAIER